MKKMSYRTRKQVKKLLAAVIATLMAFIFIVPVSATADPASATGTKVQITKVLKIGQGITVPTETFTFEFKEVKAAEAAELGETGAYIIPGASQAGNSGYPKLNDATVAYTSASRSADGTDTELTFLTSAIDLADTSLKWDVPGLYIYSVREKTGNTAGMTYDDAVYFLKVYVKNISNAMVVDSVAVYGKNDAGEWVKVDGAPNDDPEAGTSGHNDGSSDFAGNEFKFVNQYKKLVTEHPTNTNTTSGDDPTKNANEGAFKLTKDVVGNYANQSYGFDFKVTIHLPATYADYTPITAKVNGYTANIINNNNSYDISATVNVNLDNEKQYEIYLHHGDSFVINELPAGTIVDVAEQPSNMHYIPTYKGKWGGDTGVDRTGSANKGAGLASDPVVIGEKGGYIQYTNTLKDDDVTSTGIFINNLPYILMVVMAMAGIVYFTVGKKRRKG